MYGDPSSFLYCIDFFDVGISSIYFVHDKLGALCSYCLSSRASFASLRFLRDLIGIAIIRAIVSYLQSARRTSPKEVKDSAIASAFAYAKNLSIVKRELQKEEDKMEEDLNKSLKDASRKQTFILPEKGRTSKGLLAELKKRGKKENRKWEEGLCSGAVYCGEREHTELLNEAYSAFSLSNPLHPDIWPSVNQFEGEICNMTANLMNGTLQELDSEDIVDSVVACLSSGGTESIILAAKAHREHYCKTKGIKVRAGSQVDFTPPPPHPLLTQPTPPQPPRPRPPTINTRTLSAPRNSFLRNRSRRNRQGLRHPWMPQRQGSL